MEKRRTTERNVDPKSTRKHLGDWRRLEEDELEDKRKTRGRLEEDELDNHRGKTLRREGIIL